MNAKQEYKMAYRACRKWLQAVQKGTPQHIYIAHFGNIQKSYSQTIFSAAFASLVATKSLGALL